MSRSGNVEANAANNGVLIYDVDEMGEIMLRMIRAQPDLGLVPVGFLNDDSENVGRRIHGLRVVGPVSSLKDEAIRAGVVEIAVWEPALDAKALGALRTLAAAHKLRLRRLSFELAPDEGAEASSMAARTVAAGGR
jgi:FlaA1/EpsC-like NDP-sugar epimerase